MLHIPVVLSPSAVQGLDAPSQLIGALQALYRQIDQQQLKLDVILLARGGGSLEDLWAFNDEQLAHTMAQSPVPIVCGVGHETDFSIADFVADVRAPTPTAAAELCAEPASQGFSVLASQAHGLKSAMEYGLEKRAQMLDTLARRLLQPSDQLRIQQNKLDTAARLMQQGLQARWQHHANRLAQCQTRLSLLHPQHVLDRGFAWVSDEAGQVITDPSSLHMGQTLALHLAKGQRSVGVL